MSPQESIAHYRITAKLGEGGMGAVYRATDTKLNRDVAVKVLPESFAADPDRLARFRREAQVLASLNHPNIAAIYGVEERALVMELVDGPTLADRIAEGAIPLDEALPIAHQIAEAMEYAHDRGVIHRDLKPANVKVAAEGRVKVLDFGLAKAISGDGAAADPMSSPTLTMRATHLGVILGTAAYMSPEQAKGKPVDKRADIWAFGVVLVEMFSGRQMYTGDTLSETLAAVIKDSPNLSMLPPAVPAGVRHLLRRCLEKDPRQRWQAIGDVRVEIEALLADPRGALAEDRPTTAPVPLWKRAIPTAAAAAMAASVLTGVAVWSLKPSPALPVGRFAVDLEEGQNFTNTGRSVVAISPDGTEIVYLANGRLFLRSIAELEPRPVPGTENQGGVRNPVFSPDGRAIAFWAQGDAALKRIAVTGGAAVTLCPARNPTGMSWGSSGILYGQGSDGILRVSANGGKPEVIAAVKDAVAAHPRMLPDGQTLIFTLAAASNQWDTAKTVAQNLKSGARKVLIEGGIDARYAPTGHLVYSAIGTVLAAPFDPRRLQVTAEAVPVLQGVMRYALIGASQFDFSRTGSLVYVPGPAMVSSARNSLALADRKGLVESLKLPPDTYDFPRVSRDGKRLAYQTDDGKDAAIWIYDLSRATAPRRLTFQGSNRYPVWSPDGERVAFQSDREGDLGIFWQRADGTGTTERLTRSEKGIGHIPDSFSPDGRYLSYTSAVGPAAAVWMLSLRDRKATLFAGVPGVRTYASVFSPDGRWVAYSLDAGNGIATVFVQAFPSNGSRYQIAQGGHPSWSGDGKELYLDVGLNMAAVVSIDSKGAFAFGSPTPYMTPLLGSPTGPRKSDALPDGRSVGLVGAQSFPAGGPAKPQMRVVLNWFEDLKQRASGVK